jgi:hypothetical protein
MIINCKKCNRPFTCNNHDDAIAYQTVYAALVQHYRIKHPKTTDRVDREVAETLLLVEGFLRISEYTDDSNENVIDILDTMSTAIAQRLGFDVEDVDDEEEDTEVTDDTNVVVLPEVTNVVNEPIE